MNDKLKQHITEYCQDYYNCKYPEQIDNGSCSEVMPHIVEAAQQFYNIALEDVRKEKDLAPTWKDVAMIITIYELEVAEGNISRYGEAKDLQPYSERILEKFNKQREKK